MTNHLRVLQKACLLKDFAVAPYARLLISLACPPRRSSDRASQCLVRPVTRRIAHSCFRFQKLTCLSIAKGKSFDAISLTPLTNHFKVLQKAGLLKSCAAAPYAGPLMSLTRPPRTIPDRSFLSLADILPTAPLAVSLVSLTGQPLARGAARCIARCFLLLTSLPPRQSLHRSFLSPDEAPPAEPLAVSLVSLTGQPLARGATC
jgi:hypothetical protein